MKWGLKMGDWSKKAIVEISQQPKPQPIDWRLSMPKTGEIRSPGSQILLTMLSRSPGREGRLVEIKIPNADGLEGVLRIARSERGCNITEGCFATMHAQLRKYIGEPYYGLWWFCFRCNILKAAGLTTAVADERVMDAIADSSLVDESAPVDESPAAQRVSALMVATVAALSEIHNLRMEEENLEENQRALNAEYQRAVDKNDQEVMPIQSLAPLTNRTLQAVDAGDN